MKKQLEQVKAFHEAYDHPIAKKPTLIDKDLWFLRGTLLGEELEEYAKACEAGDLIEVADALADQLYILLGTMQVHGIADKIEAMLGLNLKVGGEGGDSSSDILIPTPPMITSSEITSSSKLDSLISASLSS